MDGESAVSRERFDLDGALKEEIRAKVLGEGFMKIVQSVRRGGAQFRISVRPVEIGGVRRYQAEMEAGKSKEARAAQKEAKAAERAAVAAAKAAAEAKAVQPEEEKPKKKGLFGRFKKDAADSASSAEDGSKES